MQAGRGGRGRESRPETLSRRNDKYAAGWTVRSVCLGTSLVLVRPSSWDSVMGRTLAGGGYQFPPSLGREAPALATMTDRRVERSADERRA